MISALPASSGASDDVRSYDLVWILHLVGDAQQPLHAVGRFTASIPNGDSGGNAESVIPATGETIALHAYWDRINRGVYILLSEWNCSSARQSPTETRSASSSVEWPVYRNRSPDRISTEHRSQLGNARLTMGCNRVLGPGTGATLYDYDGRGLQRLDDVSRPVAFILTTADGQIRQFSSAMHYFGSDKAWVLSHDLPPAFLRSLAGSVRLTIQNGEGATVVGFDLQGADKFSGAAREVCSGQGNGASE
jgi:hypothetical protein